MTNEIRISFPDAELLRWLQARAERDGSSLSAVIVAAVRFERQLELRREFLATWPARPTLTPEDRAAILAELAGGPRYEPTRARSKRGVGRATKVDGRATAKRRRAA